MTSKSSTKSIAVSELLPVGVLSTITGWDKLPETEQHTVETETHKLSAELGNYGRSRIHIGERLAKIQTILEPKRMFTRFLAAYNFKRSTAYNYISGFSNTSRLLPEAVVRVVASKNVNMTGIHDHQPLGVYTDAVGKLPPPQSADTVVIETWLKNVEEMRKTMRPDPPQMSSEVALKQCFRFISSKLKGIPSRGRGRRAFLDHLFGMVLTQSGISQPQTFAPEGIPDDYRTTVGRPRLATAE